MGALDDLLKSKMGGGEVPISPKEPSIKPTTSALESLLSKKTGFALPTPTKKARFGELFESGSLYDWGKVEMTPSMTALKEAGFGPPKPEPIPGSKAVEVAPGGFVSFPTPKAPVKTPPLRELLDWGTIKRLPEVWKEDEPAILKAVSDTVLEATSIKKIFSFVDKKLGITNFLRKADREFDRQTMELAKKKGISSEEIEKGREKIAIEIENERKRVAEIKEKNPTAMAVASFSGELLDMSMLISATSAVTAPIAPATKGLLARKIPMFAKQYPTKTAATLLRILSYAPQSATTFGAVEAIREGANQMEKGQFSPTKLIGATLRGIGWGTAVAVPHALPMAYMRIGGAGVVGGSWTTVETLIKNKQITKEDVPAIMRTAAVLMLFEAINSRSVSRAYQNELLANQAKWRLDNKIGKEASDLLNKLDYMAIKYKGTPQGKLAYSARNKVMAETMFKRDVDYVIAKEVAAGQWKVISPTTKGKSLSGLLTPAEKALIQHLDSMIGEPAPISFKLLEPNPKIREAHINYPDIITRIDLKLGFVVPSHISSIPALPAPTLPYIPAIMTPSGPPIPLAPSRAITTTEFITTLKEIKQAKKAKEKVKVDKEFTEKMKGLGFSDENVRSMIELSKKPIEVTVTPEEVEDIILPGRIVEKPIPTKKAKVMPEWWDDIDKIAHGVIVMSPPSADVKKDWRETLGKGNYMRIFGGKLNAVSPDEIADGLGITESELREKIADKLGKMEGDEEIKMEDIFPETKIEDGVSGELLPEKPPAKPEIEPAPVTKPKAIAFPKKMPLFDGIIDQQIGPAYFKGVDENIVYLRVDTRTGRPLTEELVPTEFVKSIYINRNEYNRVKTPQDFLNLVKEKLVVKPEVKPIPATKPEIEPVPVTKPKVKPEITKEELEVEEKAIGLFEEKIETTTTPALDLEINDEVEVFDKTGKKQIDGMVLKVGKDFVMIKEEISGLPIKHSFNFEFRVKPKREFFGGTRRLTKKGKIWESAYKPMAYGKAISSAEAISLVRQYFTDKEVRVRVQKDMILEPDGTKAIADSYNRMIRFVDHATRENVPEHEVLHSYFRLYTTPTQRVAVLNDMRKEYPFHTQIELHEQLSDDFVRWRLKLKTFTGRIAEFFKRFWRFLQRFFKTTPKNNIEQLYKDVVAKKRSKKAKPIIGPRRYAEEPLSDIEIKAFDIIQKGEPMPEELNKAVESLKIRKLIYESYVSPKEAIRKVRIARMKRNAGTISPGQIEAVQAAVEEVGLTRNVYSMMRNHFTGHKRTRIEELSKEQADELFGAILDLTPTKWGKIQIVTPEVLETMKEFIPPSVLSKPFISTGDIYKHIKEKEIDYIFSLNRPVRKVLTSGEIEPKQKKITEKIYDMVSGAEEDNTLDYRNWHRKSVDLYKKAKKEDKNVDMNTFLNIERGTTVPENTRKLATFLKRWYGGTISVMKPKKIRKGYITHTPESFWEKSNRIGLINVLREVINPNIQPIENISPGIIANLDYIVAKEKFNPYALPRSRYNAYSKKLMKATHAYAKLYYYKKHFDPITPDILKMKRFLPGGTQKYITKYLQTIGGRPLDYTVWQTKILGVPVGRWAKRTINTAIRFEYGILLGLNLSSGLGNIIGGGWNNVADMPPARLALGHKRLAMPQGWKILDKYGLTSQALYLEPVGGMLEQLTRGERALFVFMQSGEFYLRGSASLGMIPENEFKSAKLSPLTRTRIRRQISKTQGLFGPAQAPLLSQTTLLRPIWMFKHWMVNELELWASFSKETAIRMKRNPGWYGKTIGNPGLRRWIKYIIIGGLLYLYGPEFLKKEVKQKMGIPKTLLGEAMNGLEEVPVGQDLWTAIQVTNRIAHGEYSEAREELYWWVMRKPQIISKGKQFFEGFFKGEITTPTGELTERVSKAEAFKRGMVGSWTKQAQTERRLNEELNKILPVEYYTKWDWDLGPRKIKTDYQRTKENIMNTIKKKGKWDIKKLTLEIDKDIEMIYATYNSKALKKLDKFLAERAELTGAPLEEKEYISLQKKVTIQGSDIVRWYETLYEAKTLPRILRRTNL